MMMAYQEYLLVPRTEVVSISNEDPIMFAPLTNAAVTAYYAIHTALPKFKGEGDAAREEILALTHGRGIDVVIDFVGTATTLQLAAKVSRPQGRIVLVGMEGVTLNVGWGV
ncbi:hypothetical protein BKA67DRAFT_567608 [Truncatella angustata]|uniref:Alcohol dehydrogenase-like C-terminal domain-containing protein n=1 Tax=Truncatella angustata TaxID=152316 RepID=A0A9P8UIL4_9PEZI|nr:uncharacterized protein BKA67DRAFT_567608 [Truncatella angustata]KAH6652822.1 hypothetical protein BKA67DRAFT_567608 [Truncatella angustata]